MFHLVPFLLAWDFGCFAFSIAEHGDSGRVWVFDFAQITNDGNSLHVA